VEIHARFGAEMPTLKSTMHTYPIDGAAHDVGASDTAWSYRDAKWGSVFAVVDSDPANVGVIRDWSIDYSEALHPYSAGGGYVNMMMDEGQERVRASYRDNYDRLARIKATYEPENVFRGNPEHPAGGVAAALPSRNRGGRPRAALPGTPAMSDRRERQRTRPVASHARAVRRNGSSPTPRRRRSSSFKATWRLGAREAA
jgi:hypothetical protein